MFTRQEGSRGEHFTEGQFPSIDVFSPGRCPTEAEALRAEKVKHATEYWKHEVSHMTDAKTRRSEISSDDHSGQKQLKDALISHANGETSAQRHRAAFRPQSKLCTTL